MITGLGLLLHACGWLIKCLLRSRVYGESLSLDFTMFIAFTGSSEPVKALAATDILLELAYSTSKA